MKFLLLEQIIIQNVPAQARNAAEENSGCALNVEVHWELGLPMMKLGLGCLCGWVVLGQGINLTPEASWFFSLRFPGNIECLLLLL